MHLDETLDSPPKAVKPSRPHTPILRPIIVLAVGTIVLFLLVLVARDFRWRQRAVAHAEWHAVTLSKRVGEAGALPRNLEPLPVPAGSPRTVDLEWLTRDQAHLLRGVGRRLVVAQTAAPPQLLAPDGRAVIFFENGRFEVEWLTLARFDELRAARQAAIQNLATTAADTPSDQ